VPNLLGDVDGIVVQRCSQADVRPPSGLCVRNSPLRVGLDAVGIWKLPSAEDQVRAHIIDQLPKLNSRPNQAHP
jgi:hypothetical protein